MKTHLTLLVGAFIVLVSAQAAMANTYLATFSASTWKDRFSPSTLSEALAGSLIFTGPDSATVTSIDQISLSIHGHQYVASDILSNSTSGFLQFGDTNPVGVLLPLSVDHFVVSYLNGGMFAFEFTAPDTAGSRWGATNATGSISAIPLPAALPLSIAGISVLGLLTGRRKREKTTAMIGV